MFFDAFNSCNRFTECSPLSPLEEEFSAIMEAQSKCDHCFVAISTKFPGEIYTSEVLSPYHLMKINVDATRIIQLGLSLSDANGKYCGFWEFNFKDFDQSKHSYNTKTIELLKQQHIYYDYYRINGVDSMDFARLILTCGLLSESNKSRITWVTFHGAYDFGYFIKMLIGAYLPFNVNEFMELVKYFFGSGVFDMKHIIIFCNGLYGDLDLVAKTLGVEREILNPGASSDSLLTLQTFIKLKKYYFNGRSLSEFERVLHDFNGPILEPVPTNWRSKL